MSFGDEQIRYPAGTNTGGDRLRTGTESSMVKNSLLCRAAIRYYPQAERRWGALCGNKIMRYFTLLGLSLVGAASLVGTVQAAPVLVTGSLKFSTNPVNYFDPSNGFVPATTGNAAGTTVPISANTEFGYNDGANVDFADFTGTTLSIGDISLGSGAFDFVMTFTANRSHFFDNAVLGANGFGGSISVNPLGNVLTFTSPNTISGFAIRNASVTFLGIAAPLPEPATWAMMIAGFGLVGGAMRRGRKVARVVYA